MSDDRTTVTVVAAAANLNQAQNTVLLTLDLLRPARIHRFGVVADSANGLLAAGDLKLRKTPVLTGTIADIAGAVLNGQVKTRGLGLVKTLTTREVFALAGDKVTLTVEVDAGGASTGHVFIEYEPQPFVVANIANVAEETT